MNSIFTLQLPLWNIVVRTVIIYLVILIGLRISGKREIGQMTVFDLVALLLIANVVQNAMVGVDTSLTGGVVAALVLLLLNALISWMRLRSPRMRRLVEGSPTVLVLHGEPLNANMHREGIDPDTLAAALREHGVQEMSEVEIAVLEIDGSISVVPVGSTMQRVKRPIKFLRHQ